jgi:hypothetical protein
MAIGGKIWGSSYQPKKLYYQPGQYFKSLNRAASDQFFNNQRSAVSNVWSISAGTSYSSLELTLKGVQQRAFDEFKTSQSTMDRLKSKVDISV